MAMKVLSDLFPSTALMEKSLVSHMISNSLFQFGIAMIGVTPRPERVYSMCNRRVANVHQGLP